MKRTFKYCEKAQTINDKIVAEYKDLFCTNCEQNEAKAEALRCAAIESASALQAAAKAKSAGLCDADIALLGRFLSVEQAKEKQQPAPVRKTVRKKKAAK